MTAGCLFEKIGIDKPESFLYPNLFNQRATNRSAAIVKVFSNVLD